MERRSQRAVILARGASRRMGFPKGLARRPGQASCFLQIILDLYARFGVRSLVICGGDAADAYHPILEHCSVADGVVAGGGGDTARTLGWALDALPQDVRTVWAHPVDVPDVESATLALLEQEAAGSAEVVRPAFDGQPGHPVVLPRGALERIDGMLGGTGRGEGLRARSDSMGAVLAELVQAGRMDPLRWVPVTDPGVTRDYDEREELHGPAE